MSNYTKFYEAASMLRQAYSRTATPNESVRYKSEFQKIRREISNDEIRKELTLLEATILSLAKNKEDKR